MCMALQACWVPRRWDFHNIICTLLLERRTALHTCFFFKRFRHVQMKLHSATRRLCSKSGTVAVADILQPHVKLRQATVNRPTMSEGNVLQLFWTSLRARCMSSDETVLVKTNTTTTSYEARKPLHTTEGKRHVQVTFSPGTWHFSLQETREVRCILPTCPRATAQGRTTSQKGRSMIR